MELGSTISKLKKMLVHTVCFDFCYFLKINNNFDDFEDSDHGKFVERYSRRYDSDQKIFHPKLTDRWKDP